MKWNFLTFTLTYFFVNDSSIARHNVTKLLGVSPNDKLQFPKHVDDVCMKASRQVKALIRIRRYLDVKDRYRMYERLYCQILISVL